MLLRYRCLQLVNFEIERGVLGAVGNGLARAPVGIKSTSVPCTGGEGERPQPSFGIDHHGLWIKIGGNRRTVDVGDKAPVTYLAKCWIRVHTRVVADDHIVIGGGETRPGQSAHAHVVGSGLTVLERQIADGSVILTVDVALHDTNTQGCVVEAVGVGDERVKTDGRVGAGVVVLGRINTDRRGAASVSC